MNQAVRDAAKKIIDIEALLGWAVRREFAHIHAEQSGLFEAEAAAGDHEWHGSSADGCVAVARIAGLGCRPDGGIGYGGGHCHPDAETAYITARRVLERPDFGLAIEFAKLDDRPSWGDHIKPVEARPLKLSWDLKPLVMWAGRGRKAVPYCPLRVINGANGSVIYTVRETEILAAHRFYWTWWVALERVAEALRLEGRLRRYEVTGPSAPSCPWESRGDGGGEGAPQDVAKSLDFVRTS